MSHFIVSQLLGEYVDGVLADADVARVEEHLQDCEECSRDLAELRWALGELQEAYPEVDPGEDFTARVLVAVAGAPPPLRLVWRRRAAWLRPVATVAAACFVVVLGATWLLNSVSRDGGSPGGVEEADGDAVAALEQPRSEAPPRDLRERQALRERFPATSPPADRPPKPLELLDGPAADAGPLAASMSGGARDDGDAVSDAAPVAEEKGPSANEGWRQPFAPTPDGTEGGDLSIVDAAGAQGAKREDESELPGAAIMPPSAGAAGSKSALAAPVEDWAAEPEEAVELAMAEAPQQEEALESLRTRAESAPLGEAAVSATRGSAPKKARRDRSRSYGAGSAPPPPPSSSAPVLDEVVAGATALAPVYAEWVLYTERSAELRDINSVCQAQRLRCEFSGAEGANQLLTNEANHARVWVTLRPDQVAALRAAIGDRISSKSQNEDASEAPRVRVRLDVEYAP
jgi:hypothetical protein